jgi:hypothetical protein
MEPLMVVRPVPWLSSASGTITTSVAIFLYNASCAVCHQQSSQLCEQLPSA